MNLIQKVEPKQTNLLISPGFTGEEQRGCERLEGAWGISQLLVNALILGGTVTQVCPVGEIAVCAFQVHFPGVYFT